MDAPSGTADPGGSAELLQIGALINGGILLVVYPPALGNHRRAAEACLPSGSRAVGAAMGGKALLREATKRSPSDPSIRQSASRLMRRTISCPIRLQLAAAPRRGRRWAHAVYLAIVAQRTIPRRRR